MFKKLTLEEIEKFADKYMPEWKGDIFEVIFNDLYGLKSYLVNGHYLLMDLNGKIVENDLQ